MLFFALSLSFSSFKWLVWTGLIAMLVNACSLWHFCMPSGHRFIIIWFSSHFVSKFMIFRSFFVCACRCFNFSLSFSWAFCLLSGFCVLPPIPLADDRFRLRKVAFHHLINSSYLIELIISARDDISLSCRNSCHFICHLAASKSHSISCCLLFIRMLFGYNLNSSPQHECETTFSHIGLSVFLRFTADENIAILFNTLDRSVHPNRMVESNIFQFLNH